jgi:hypothetical protein
MKVFGGALEGSGIVLKHLGRGIRKTPAKAHWLRKATVRGVGGVTSRVRSAGKSAKLAGMKAVNQAERLGQKWAQMSPTQKVLTIFATTPLDTMLAYGGYKAVRHLQRKSKRKRQTKSEYIPDITKPTASRI